MSAAAAIQQLPLEATPKQHVSGQKNMSVAKRTACETCQLKPMMITVMGVILLAIGNSDALLWSCTLT